MNFAVICDAVRTPFGRYGGALSSIRTDDLAAIPIRALMERNAHVDWQSVDDVILGCANQAGEDTTVNRLCGSSLDAIGIAARAIECGEADLIIAGGVENMSRAPFVIGKADSAFSRSAEIFDTTIGWRFVNPAMKVKYGIDSMAETAENVARDFRIARSDQDAFALRTQQRWAKAQSDGFFRSELISVLISQKNGDAKLFDSDEHPRPDTTFENLSKLKPIVKANGTITAGNASGINDGACALLLASEAAALKYGLTGRARIIATAVAGVEPRIMGMGPVPATRKVLYKTRRSLAQMNVIELNEAFAAQALAVLRELGLPDHAEHVNPNGGAIAIGHPLGASGARLITTAMYQLEQSREQYALCTMCVGVGQGIATILERC
jgi:3-oxoadipyl-CoA thiolase